MNRICRLGVATAILISGATGLAAQRSVVISEPGRIDSLVRRCLTPASGGPARLTDAEVAAGRSPRDPNHLVAAWQMGGGPAGMIQASASFDGGRTWTAPKPLPISGCAGGPAAAIRASDPSVTVDGRGWVHVVAIGWQPGQGDGPDRYNALIVVTSRDGGRSWGHPVIASEADVAGSVSYDNVSIAADPTAPGRLVLATTRYAPVTDSSGRVSRTGRLAIAVSRDDGATWEPVRTVSPSVPGRISAPQLVAHGGRIMAFYFRSGAGRRLIGWQLSSDGGATWDPEREIAGYTGARWEIPAEAGGREFILAGDIVQAAIDPNGDAIHVAFADGRKDPGGRLGVSLVSSFDRGKSWSTPLSVSADSTVTGWLPAVAVDAVGEVAVGSLSADFSKGQSTGATIDYHLTRFRRAGRSLAPIGDVVVGRGGLIWPGDYHALIATTDGFRLVTVISAGADPANLTDVAVMSPR